MKTALQTWRDAHNEWETALNEEFEDVIVSHMQAYARQCCEDLLQRCAENAKCRTPHLTTVDKQSILDTPIELP